MNMLTAAEARLNTALANQKKEEKIIFDFESRYKDELKSINQAIINASNEGKTSVDVHLYLKNSSAEKDKAIIILYFSKMHYEFGKVNNDSSVMGRRFNLTGLDGDKTRHSFNLRWE